MAFEREDFKLAGPLYLTTVDWTNTHHQRCVAASLVQGVYVLELDRQEKRQGSEALAPPWWEFFHFQLLQQLIDNDDNTTFGAIYEYIPDINCSTENSPRYVVAFRGTLPKADTFSQDLKHDLYLIRNTLHRTSRSEMAIQSVRNVIARAGETNIWLTGHSLGSAMALLAGKNLAKTGTFLEAFLFNPPFISAPIERIKYEKVKHGLRIASSLLTAGLTVAMKSQQQRNNILEDPFVSLSSWVPLLFVNRDDHICSEYIGYFEHRGKMEELGAGGIERLATQNSIGGLSMRAMGKEAAEPIHLIPSANLTVNLTPMPDFKRNHGIHQWWRTDLHLHSKVFSVLNDQTRKVYGHKWGADHNGTLLRLGYSRPSWSFD